MPYPEAEAIALAQLRADEGLELAAYPDPLSDLAKACVAAGVKPRDWRKLPNATHLDGSPWTIGYGCASASIFPGLTWTEAQAEARLADDVAKVMADLDRKLPWWTKLSPPRASVLINMAYNLGIGHAPAGKDPGAGLLGFPNTLSAMKRGAYATAAEGMRASRWYRQVKGRAERLARQMETGVRDPS